MRVAVYHNNKDVRIEDRPKPEIGPGEILFKVMACGICGSDVMEWYRIKRAPLVLGHEAAGVVEQAGEGVKYKPGDRVFVSHHVPCDECHYCRSGHHTACETLHTTNFHPGGFSEFIQVPKINVEKGAYLLPENMSFEEATLIEPLACVCRGQRLARLKPGQTVLVLGSGVSGQLHIRLAKALGAGKVISTDVSQYRLDFARKSGADATIDAREDVPGKVKEANGRLADLVILCTGAKPALDQALDSVDRGGTILFFAVPPPTVETPIPLTQLWRNEVTLLTSYGAAPQDLEQSLELISSGKVQVKDLITHKLPLEKAGEGFKLVAEAGESMKVVLEPHK